MTCPVTGTLSITLSAYTVSPGNRVVATVSGAAVGALVTVTVAGVPVGSGITPLSTCAVSVGFNAPNVSGGHVVGTISYHVAPSVDPSFVNARMAVVTGLPLLQVQTVAETFVPVQVCGLSAGFAPACATLEIAEATPAAPVLSVPVPGGKLAFTGVDVGLMVLVALALIAAGALLLWRSRRSGHHGGSKV
ncbi:MAG: hypothetical protein ACRDX8_07195 [Acidimicrobiales bacterium]